MGVDVPASNELDLHLLGWFGCNELVGWCLSEVIVSNMDPDSVARHNGLLRRAGFTDNAHAKGFF